jgi:hypothetical protein
MGDTSVSGVSRRRDLDGEEAGPAAPPRDEREERKVAAARLDALVSDPGHPLGDPKHYHGLRPDSCGDFKHPMHDFNPCEGAPVADRVLYGKQAGDVDAIDQKDVMQSHLGDCSLHATLMGLARTSEGREVIRKAITENKNDKGETVSYGVRLYDPDGQPRVFTVDGNFGEGHAAAREIGEEHEVWPLVIEKAYAQRAGGYDAIGHGGNAKDAMEALTGEPASTIHLGEWSVQDGYGWYPESQLKHDLDTHCVIVLGTKEKETLQGQYGLEGNHAYLVEGYEEKEGKLLLRLRNPWGEAYEPKLVPFEKLNELCYTVDVGAAPPCE